jgi:hypothetical protein
MQQQTMPTAISMGEKQARHQEAPMGSELTSPKILNAQSMRRTARTVKLGFVSGDLWYDKCACETYKHPSRKRINTEIFFLLGNWAVKKAGKGAKRMMTLKKTCREPIIMQDILLCSSHLPGGWHVFIQLMRA